jgi:hypothetical protein
MKMETNGINMLLGVSTSMLIRVFLEYFRFCVRF